MWNQFTSYYKLVNNLKSMKSSIAWRLILYNTNRTHIINHSWSGLASGKKWNKNQFSNQRSSSCQSQRTKCNNSGATSLKKVRLKALYRLHSKELSVEKLFTIFWYAKSRFSANRKNRSWLMNFTTNCWCICRNQARLRFWKAITWIAWISLQFRTAQTLQGFMNS